MDKLLIGRYVPGNSIVHRLDPRAKFIASFYFIVLIFFANNWATYGVTFLFTIGCILLSRVPLNFFWKGIRPLVWLILFTVVLQIFFSTGGTVYFEWRFIHVTAFGLENGAMIFCRFILIIMMSTILTLTTPPLSIADAVEAILKPLKVVKFPVHEVALMLSIALRFVPTLMDETIKIMNAQRARGVDFSEGNLLQKIKHLVPLLIPLFVSAFKRAEDLAIAMEARGYQGGEGRTKFRRLIWHMRDSVMVLVFVAFTAVFIGLRIYL